MHVIIWWNESVYLFVNKSLLFYLSIYLSIYQPIYLSIIIMKIKNIGVFI